MRASSSHCRVCIVCYTMVWITVIIEVDVYAIYNGPWTICGRYYTLWGKFFDTKYNKFDNIDDHPSKYTLIEEI